MVVGGLTSKNGVDYFPEEFLPDKKKLAKKIENELRMKQSASHFQSEVIDNGFEEGPQILNSEPAEP